MNWDDPYLQSRFTPDAYESILELLRVDEPDTQICALMELAETLSYGNDDLLGNFPLREMSAQMVRLLRDGRYDYVQSNAAQCISRFLDCHTSSTRNLIENGLLEVLRDKLLACSSVDILRDLAHACSIIAQYRPNDIGAVVGISPLLNAINYLPVPDQKSISKAILLITSQTYYDNFLDSFDSLIALMNISDPIISQNCLNSALNILSNSAVPSSKNKNMSVAIKTLCNILPSLQDSNQIHQIIQYFFRMSSNPETGKDIIDAKLDFNFLIGSTIVEIDEYEYDENENGGSEEINQDGPSPSADSGDRSISEGAQSREEPPPRRNLSPEDITLTYKIILNLLPPPTIPGNGMWDNKRKPPANAASFAKYIQPILTNVLVKTVEVNILALVSLSQTLKFTRDFKVTDELVHSLCCFTHQQNLLPYILYFVDCCPKPQNDQIFVKSGLISLLCCNQPPPDSHLFKWYGSILRKTTKGKMANFKTDAFKFSSFKSIWPLIEQLKELSSYQLLQDGFFDHMKNLFDMFIQSQKQKGAKKHSMFELQSLIEELTELLHFLPIQKVNDPYSYSLFDPSGIRSTIMISLKKDEQNGPQKPTNGRRRLRHSSDNDDGYDNDEEEDGLERNGVQHTRYNQKNCVIFAEGYYNYEVLHIPDRVIYNGWPNLNRLSQMIQCPQNLDQVSFTQLAIYHRLINSENYKKCSFLLNGQKEIFPYDPLFRILEMNKNKVIAENNGRSDINPERISLVQLDCSANYDEKKNDMLSVLEVPTNLIDPQMKKVLDFMKYLQLNIFPLMLTAKQSSPSLPKSPSSASSLSFRNHKFESRLIMTLSSPYLTITCNTPAVQIIANYPFLFSYEARFYVYKTTTLSFMSSLKNTVRLKNFVSKAAGGTSIRNFFGRENNPLNDNSTHIKVRLNREKIFDDGCILLKSFGHPFLLFDISYEGEEGIGIGPTQEFFALMSREFAKKKRNMWIDDDIGNRDPEGYAMSAIGLYPKVGASPELFNLLGKFCGKSVEMGYLVPIPLSRSFFRAFNGEEIGLEDIDEQLAKSIETATAESLYGFTFVYPGTEFEMVKNGSNIEVTDKNLEKYKSLVRKFATNLDCIDAFKSGFHSIVSPGIDDMFDADDLMRLISGDDTSSSSNSLSKSDLQQNVIISHGYEKTSPQIGQLFEVIESFSRSEKALFIKFVTGCERLPVGGLKNLTPKLTIARKVPEINGQNPDDLLPSVMTCTNYFKLPPYTSKQIMKEKILYAISEGQGVFLLT